MVENGRERDCHKREYGDAQQTRDAVLDQRLPPEQSAEDREFVLWSTLLSSDEPSFSDECTNEEGQGEKRLRIIET